MKVEVHVEYDVEITQGRDFHTDEPLEIARIARVKDTYEHIILLARSPGEDWRITWIGEPGHAVRVIGGELLPGPMLLKAIAAHVKERAAA